MGKKSGARLRAHYKNLSLETGDHRGRVGLHDCAELGYQRSPATGRRYRPRNENYDCLKDFDLN
jgi:hypothetical protein